MISALSTQVMPPQTAKEESTFGILDSQDGHPSLEKESNEGIESFLEMLTAEVPEVARGPQLKETTLEQAELGPESETLTSHRATFPAWAKGQDGAQVLPLKIGTAKTHIAADKTQVATLPEDRKSIFLSKNDLMDRYDHHFGTKVIDTSPLEEDKLISSRLPQKHSEVFEERPLPGGVHLRAMKKQGENIYAKEQSERTPFFIKPGRAPAVTQEGINPSFPKEGVGLEGIKNGTIELTQAGAENEVSKFKLQNMDKRTAVQGGVENLDQLNKENFQFSTISNGSNFKIGGPTYSSHLQPSNIQGNNLNGAGNSADSNAVIDKITNYVLQNSFSNQKTVNLSFHHGPLGKVDIRVERGPNDLLDINIASSTKEGIEFFRTHRAELIGHLNSSGVHVSELKVEGSLWSNSLGDVLGQNSGQSSSEKGSMSDKGASQQNLGHNREEGQRQHDSQKRADLWKLAMEGRNIGKW